MAISNYEVKRRAAMNKKAEYEELLTQLVGIAEGRGYVSDDWTKFNFDLSPDENIANLLSEEDYRKIQRNDMDYGLMCEITDALFNLHSMRERIEYYEDCIAYA